MNDKKLGYRLFSICGCFIVVLLSVMFIFSCMPQTKFKSIVGIESSSSEPVDSSEPSLDSSEPPKSKKNLDILFVVSNSWQMSGFQEKLANAFSVELFTKLAEYDWRVAITSDTPSSFNIVHSKCIEKVSDSSLSDGYIDWSEFSNNIPANIVDHMKSAVRIGEESEHHCLQEAAAQGLFKVLEALGAIDGSPCDKWYRDDSLLVIVLLSNDDNCDQPHYDMKCFNFAETDTKDINGKKCDSRYHLNWSTYLRANWITSYEIGMNSIDAMQTVFFDKLVPKKAKSKIMMYGILNRVESAVYQSIIKSFYNDVYDTSNIFDSSSSNSWKALDLNTGNYANFLNHVFDDIVDRMK